MGYQARHGRNTFQGGKWPQVDRPDLVGSSLAEAPAQILGGRNAGGHRQHWPGWGCLGAKCRGVGAGRPATSSWRARSC